MQNMFLVNLWNEIRQWGYPREFRISSGIVGGDAGQLNELIKALDTMVANIASQEFQARLQKLSAVNDQPFITDWPPDYGAFARTLRNLVRGNRLMKCSGAIAIWNDYFLI
jgi:hypothetical protein